MGSVLTNAVITWTTEYYAMAVLHPMGRRRHHREDPRPAAIDRRQTSEESGMEGIADKASGKLARRPELHKALLVAHRPGDQLVVTKLDWLGRSLEHVIDLSTQLQERGVDLVVLDRKIDTSTAMGRMFFQILGSIAEFEHALVSERTLDGLAGARARGRNPADPEPGEDRPADVRGDRARRTPDAHRRADRRRVRRHPAHYRHLAKVPAQTPTS